MKIGALFVLAIGFALAAALKAGEVVAGLPLLAADDGFGNPVAVQSASPPAAAKSMTMDPADTIEALRVMRAELKERENALRTREITLQTLEKRMRERLEGLKDAREKLERTASQVDNAAGKDVRHLASMYQQMKPKQAGEIFNQMAPSFAAGFISEMRPDAAALILANMEAEKAYAVSLLIAGRNMIDERAQPAVQN